MLFYLLLLTGASALQVGAPMSHSRVASQGIASRCATVLARAGVDDKAEVEEYFNNEGFNRWSRIYSEDGEVNSVQLDIRNGHAQTVDKVLKWVDADGTAASGESFADVGCGVGSLSLPLAERGAKVTASDISAAMVEEATKRAASAGLSDRATFTTSDLEKVEGTYETVTCIDVMIHYPQEKMAEMVQGLASKAEKRLIISFAPDTWYYRALKVRPTVRRAARPPDGARTWRHVSAMHAAAHATVHTAVPPHSRPFGHTRDGSHSPAMSVRGLERAWTRACVDSSVRGLERVR